MLWLLTMAALGAWVGVMALDNVPPYDYVSGIISPDPARQGGRVVLTWQIKTHRLCPGSVQRTLIDNATGKVVAQYDPTPASLTVSLNDTELKKSFLLPDDLPNELRYEAVVSFRCNPLQALFPIKVYVPTVIFHIN